MPLPSLHVRSSWMCGVASTLCIMACQDPEPLEPKQDAGISEDMRRALDMPKIQDMGADASMPPRDLGRDMPLPDLGDQPDTATMDMMREDAAPDLVDMPAEVLRTFLYVGGGQYRSDGFVSRFRLDTQSGEFDDVQRVLNQGQNLSYLAIDESRGLMHVSDEGSTNVYTVKIDLKTGLKVGTETSANAQCHGVHTMLDASGDHLVMSCYQEGQTSLLRLDEGAHALNWINTVDSGRKSHQAARSPDGRHVFVVSLEEQHIARYAITRDALEPVDPIYTQVPDRIGPRHMAFHPTLPLAYILGESKPVLMTATYSNAGTLDQLNSTGLDEGEESFETAGAAVRVHPSGRWILSTQRFLDGREGRVVVTELDAQGRPTTHIRHSSSMGLAPRDLSLSHDGKLVAVSNRRSEEVVIFEFDAGTGSLTLVQRLGVPSAPHVAVFLDVREQAPR